MVNEQTAPEEEVQQPEGEETPTPESHEGDPSQEEETPKQKRKKFFENLPKKTDELKEEKEVSQDYANSQDVQSIMLKIEEKKGEIEELCERYPGMYTKEEKNEILKLSLDPRANNLKTRAIFINYDPDKYEKHVLDQAHKLKEREAGTKTGEQKEGQKSGRLSAQELDQKRAQLGDAEFGKWWQNYRKEVLGHR